MNNRTIWLQLTRGNLFFILPVKGFTFLVLAILLSLLSFCCKAECTSYQPGSISFNMGEVIVPYNPDVGTVLKEVSIASPPFSANGCQMVNDAFSKYTTGNPTGLKYKQNDIYSTNIPGIGFAICYWNCDNANGGGWYPFVTLNNHLNYNSINYGGAPFHFLLIVTGEVDGSGPLDLGEYGEVGVSQTAIAKIVLTGGSIKATQCNSEQNNILIDFGGLPAEQFTSIGATTLSKEFNIGLTCDGKANISVALEGQQSEESSDSSILALTNMGQKDVATGLGVQIIYNGNPLEINKKIPLKTTEGNIIETFPFSARYYQTKSVVTPGEANVVATLSITHQ